MAGTQSPSPQSATVVSQALRERILYYLFTLLVMWLVWLTQNQFAALTEARVIEISKLYSQYAIEREAIQSGLRDIDSLRDVIVELRHLKVQHVQLMERISGLELLVQHLQSERYGTPYNPE